MNVEEAAKKYGNQCVVISADIKRVDGVFRVFAKGGRENTGMEAISWIKKCVELGAGEVVVNSIDTDGVKGGFDIELLERVCDAVNVPVIASGGAGNIQHFIDLMVCRANRLETQKEQQVLTFCLLVNKLYCRHPSIHLERNVHATAYEKAFTGSPSTSTVRYLVKISSPEGSSLSAI